MTRIRRGQGTTVLGAPGIVRRILPDGHCEVEFINTDGGWLIVPSSLLDSAAPERTSE